MSRSGVSKPIVMSFVVFFGTDVTGKRKMMGPKKPEAHEPHKAFSVSSEAQHQPRTLLVCFVF